MLDERHRFIMIRYPVSSIKQPVSIVQYPVSSIE